MGLLLAVFAIAVGRYTSNAARAAGLTTLQSTKAKTTITSTSSIIGQADVAGYRATPVERPKNWQGLVADDGDQFIVVESTFIAAVFRSLCIERGPGVAGMSSYRACWDNGALVEYGVYV